MEENNNIQDFDENTDEHKIKFIKLAKIFLIFAIICFVTSIFFDSNVGNPIKTTLPNTGGTIGPIEVKKDKAVYSIKVSQSMNTNQWSNVEGNVLDNNKQYLFGFGKELWDEDGTEYDPEDGTNSYWHESDTNYDAKLTFPKRGIYYLQFETEMSNPVDIGNINVEIMQKQASSLAFFWLAILSIIASGISFIIANLKVFEDLSIF